MRRFVILLVFCVGCIAPRYTRNQARISLLSLHLNPIVTSSKIPVVFLPNVSDESMNAFNTPSIVNPDPMRIDTRYQLSQEEILFILQREDGLRDAGLLGSESLETTKNDIVKAVSFLPLDASDREAYLDEIELGLPHKERELSDAHWEAHLKKLEGMTENFYAETWTG